MPAPSTSTGTRSSRSSGGRSTSPSSAAPTARPSTRANSGWPTPTDGFTRRTTRTASPSAPPPTPRSSPPRSRASSGPRTTGTSRTSSKPTTGLDPTEREKAEALRLRLAALAERIDLTEWDEAFPQERTPRPAGAAVLAALALADGRLRDQLPPLLRHQRARRAADGGRRTCSGKPTASSANSSRTRPSPASASTTSTGSSTRTATSRASASSARRRSGSRRSSLTARRCPRTGPWRGRRATGS